ncbi:MAG TPA: hypothetical protein DDW90_08505 [Cyanobacteria bacterium UBA9971]|nr:hypothetical protein [Cyanobacteria bacterium UBA9971]
MRGYRDFKPKKKYIDMPDRVLSTLVYAPFWGWLISLGWLIVSHIKGKSLSSFARFNIFQSIFISILIFIFDKLIGIIYNTIGIIPFIGNIIQDIIYYPILYPLIMGFPLYQLALIILYGYLMFYAFTGRFGRVPWVSDMVKQMV